MANSTIPNPSPWKILASPFGDAAGSFLAYDSQYKIVEFSCSFNELANASTITASYSFPVVSSNRTISGIGYSESDGKWYSTGLSIRTDGTIKVYHSINSNLKNCRYYGKVYIG